MSRSDDSQKPEPDLQESFGARLRQKYGEGVDPEVSLGGEPSDAPSGATKELLKRLGGHGVNAPRYQLEGEIARGGMGAILRVWDEDLRRHLAMKVVLGKGEGGAPLADARERDATPQVDAKVLARFLEEAQVTSQLDHPGIVPVHELGLDADGRVYFTMKLVKGRDLKHVFDLLIDEKEGWNETRALGVILKACEAMAYAHKKGVIHRDLKPANVMVGNYGEVFVMDWGLARVLGRRDRHDIRLEAEGGPRSGSSLTSVKTERREEREDAPDSPLVTMDGDVMGTPAYMPPEQARGEIEKLSQRSDVYSIGAMLYHLLARQIPYVPPGTRMTNRTVLARVLEGPPKLLHEINKDVPAELVAICEKAMTRDAAGRYADTLALAEDLRAYLEHRVVAAYETGAAAELKKWVKRNKPLATAMAGGVAVLVAGVVTSMNFAVRARDRTVEVEKARTETAEKNTKLEETNRLLAVAKHAAERNEEHAQQQSYVANIIAAEASLRANEDDEARRRLDACSESLRGWEWRYLHLATDTGRTVLDKCLYLGPSFTATFANDPYSMIPSARSIAFSPDSLRLASATQGKVVRIWNTTSGENLLELQEPEWVMSLAFSPDGARIASGSADSIVRVWNATSGEALLALRGHQNSAWSVVFSSDGSRIASGSADNMVRVWNSISGEPLLLLRGHAGTVFSVAFSLDGSRIASAGADEAICVWEAARGEHLLTLRGHAGPVGSVTFNPDGSRIASAGSDNTVRMWDAISGENLLTLRGHDSPVNSVAFSPDGSRIASAGADKTIRVWNAINGESLLILRGHDSQVISFAFSLDGSSITSASFDHTVRDWSATSGGNPLVLRGHGEAVTSVAASPDGSRVASASWDRAIRVWDMASGENLMVLRGHELGVVFVAFSPDGARIASASQDKTVRLWDASHGQNLLVLRGHEEPVTSLAFSPDGSRIVSASWDNSIRVWNATSGENLFVLRGHEGQIFSVAFSPDGSRIASASGDSSVRVWNASSGENLLVLHGHDWGVDSIVFSPDGARIASAGSDRTIRVWSTSSGESLLVLRGHEWEVSSITFSPDGSRIASASGDKTVRVWNAMSGEGLLVLRGHERGVQSVVFSPDGSCIVSGSSDNTVRVWDTSATAVHAQSRQRSNVASSLVQSLLERLTLVEAVIENLQTDTSLGEEVRSVAIRLASSHENNPFRLNEASWSIVRQPLGDLVAYKRAARMAQVACDMRPSDGALLNTLGVAQYRVGQYERALETLTRSDELNRHGGNPKALGAQPGDVAFIAMTHHQLGNAMAAQTSLLRLRELIQVPGWSENVEARKHLEEAESLIAGPSLLKSDNR